MQTPSAVGSSKMYIYIFFIVQIHRVIEFIFPSARALKKNDQVNNVTYGFCPGTAVILAVQTSMSKAHASSTLSLVGILDKERLAGTRPPEPRAPPQAPSGLDAAARVSLPGAPTPAVSALQSVKQTAVALLSRTRRSGKGQTSLFYDCSKLRGEVSSKCVGTEVQGRRRSCFLLCIFSGSSHGDGWPKGLQWQELCPGPPTLAWLLAHPFQLEQSAVNASRSSSYFPTLSAC